MYTQELIDYSDSWRPQMSTAEDFLLAHGGSEGEAVSRTVS